MREVKIAFSKKRIEEIIERARDFNKNVSEKVSLEIDRRTLTDPHYFDWEVVKRGCEYGFLSFPIPRFMGGGGATVTEVAVLLEELSYGCAGIANIFGAHYLGLSGILMSFDLSIYDRFLREVVEGERKGVPVLFSAAVTEPTAGTDVENRELLLKAKLVTEARRVEGGFLLNGRKVFISNGSVAKYHVVICAVDRNSPLETWSGFIVPANSKGFSVGRVERKMGQRACHAGELIFEDCFVPEENNIGVVGKAMDMTEIVLAASRPPVAAIATGIARKAYDLALNYAREKGLMKNEKVQMKLAEMRAKIEMARAIYLKAGNIFDEFVYGKVAKELPLMEPFLKILNPLRRTSQFLKITSSRRWKGLTVRILERRIDREWVSVSLGFSSLAKFSASDIAVDVCLSALEIMGIDGIFWENEVEKCLRDAKLTQIYEGTNQLNRYEVFKNLVEV